MAFSGGEARGVREFAAVKIAASVAPQLTPNSRLHFDLGLIELCDIQVLIKKNCCMFLNKDNVAD